MSRYEDGDRALPKSLLLALAVYAVLVGLGLLYLASEGLGWKDLEKLSTPQQALAVLVFAPCVPLLYTLAEAAGELIFWALALTTFKIVTLGQIGIGDSHHNYTLGLARDYDGQLVASEGFIGAIAFLVWIAIGIAAYCWWPGS